MGRTPLSGCRKDHSTRLPEGPLSGCRISHSTRMLEGPLCQDLGRTAFVRIQEGPLYQDPGRTTLPGSRKDHSARAHEGPLYQDSWKSAFPQSIKTAFILPGFRWSVCSQQTTWPFHRLQLSGPSWLDLWIDLLMFYFFIFFILKYLMLCFSLL